MHPHRRRAVVLVATLLVAVGGSIAGVEQALAQNPFLAERGQRTIGSITFFGNEVTREYVLRRELPFAEGDPWRSELVPEAREKLDALPFVAYVDIQPKMTSPTRVDIVIQVEEEDRFGWGIGLEYERRHDAWLGELSAGLINLTGRGETLEGRLTVFERLATELLFTNPHVLGPADVGVFLDSWWQSYEWRYEAFDYSDWGFGAGAYREFGSWARVQVRAVWREIEASELAIDLPAGTRVTSDFVEQDPIVELTLVHDSRDLRYYPRKGVHARGDLRLGGLGRDFDYTVAEGTVSAFWRFPWVEVLAGHVGLRTASTRLPVWERTYLGGPMSLRGVDFGSVSGDEAWRATVEWRRPLVLVPLRRGRAVGVGLHAFTTGAEPGRMARASRTAGPAGHAGWGCTSTSTPTTTASSGRAPTTATTCTCSRTASRSDTGPTCVAGMQTAGDDGSRTPVTAGRGEGVIVVSEQERIRLTQYASAAG